MRIGAAADDVHVIHRPQELPGTTLALGALVVEPRGPDAHGPAGLVVYFANVFELRGRRAGGILRDHFAPAGDAAPDTRDGREDGRRAGGDLRVGASSLSAHYMYS